MAGFTPIKVDGNMFKIFIIAREGKDREELYLSLVQKGYACAMAGNQDEVSQIAEQDPDLVLVADNSHSRIRELAHEIKQKKNLPIIALVEREMLKNVDGHLDLIDDFVLRPYDLREVNLRVERLLRKTSQAETDDTIRCGDLTIDLAKYEVSVGGRPVILTFKEYELLKFLASNAGRVFTREALLNKVWGYDYYGGDRTVDVHITRLRSKIENLSNIFIETVRNIGYRLRADT
jgi:DNA-binding response OmpR family regulator